MGPPAIDLYLVHLDVGFMVLIPKSSWVKLSWQVVGSVS